MQIRIKLTTQEIRRCWDIGQARFNTDRSVGANGKWFTGEEPIVADFGAVCAERALLKHLGQEAAWPQSHKPDNGYDAVCCGVPIDCKRTFYRTGVLMLPEAKIRDHENSQHADSLILVLCVNVVGWETLKDNTVWIVGFMPFRQFQERAVVSDRARKERAKEVSRIEMGSASDIVKYCRAFNAPTQETLAFVA